MRKTAALALAAAMSVLWCGNAFAQSVLAQLPTVSCTEDITYTQAEMLKIVNDSARLQRRTAENAQAAKQPVYEQAYSDDIFSLHSLIKR